MDGIGDILQQFSDAIGTWGVAGPLAGLAAVINILVLTTKLPFLDKLIKPSWRPWIAGALGLISGTLASLAGGTSLIASLLAGLVAGLAAIGGHEVMTNVPGSAGAARTNVAGAIAEVMATETADIKVQVDGMRAAITEASHQTDEASRMKALADLVDTPPLVAGGKK